MRVVDARRVGEGASGRNGGFALTGNGRAVRRGGGIGRARACAGTLAVDGGRAATRWATLAGDAFRHVGSLRLAADAEEREDLRDELEALRADGLDAEWVDAPGGAARRPVPGRDPTPDRRCAPAGAHGCAGSRPALPRPGAEIVEGRRVDRARASSEAEHCRHRNRRVPERAPRRDRRADRADEKDRSSRPSRSTSVSSRCRTTVATVSTTGTRPRTAGSSRVASGTCRSSREFTAEEALTDNVQEALSVLRRTISSVASFASTTAGPASSASSSTSSPWSGDFPGRSRHLGRRRVLRPRQRPGLRERSPRRAGHPRRPRPAARPVRACTAARLTASSPERRPTPSASCATSVGHARSLPCVGCVRARAAGSSISTDRSSAARAMARSWIASPVESNNVTSSAPARPSAARRRVPLPAGSHRRASRMPASTAAASSPPWLACSQSSQKSACAHELRRRDLGLAGPVRAHEGDVLPGRAASRAR